MPGENLPAMTSADLRQSAAFAAPGPARVTTCASSRRSHVSAGYVIHSGVMTLSWSVTPAPDGRKGSAARFGQVAPAAPATPAAMRPWAAV